MYLAQNFAWANRMFETNQGPSGPAHQFLFGGTSALSAAGDAQATFVSENFTGCVAPLNNPYYLVSPATAPNETKLFNNPPGAVCATHDTLVSLLGNNYTWRYYAVGDATSGISNDVWNAPLWIQSICQPNSSFTKCVGADYLNNVDLRPADALTDFQDCELANMVWVTPTGLDSDHPSGSNINPANGGPGWVANVINALSNSPCTDTVNGVAVPYWQDTAIVVTWDDWGGFYDHVLPTFLSAPNQGLGDFELGFRVPLIFVSAYTRPMIDSTNQYDVGSILRFAEHNFGITEGALGFADSRATTDLTTFYNFSLPPQKFQIPTTVPASFFLNDKRPFYPPDTD
jgi:phospholipase C